MQLHVKGTYIPALLACTRSLHFNCENIFIKEGSTSNTISQDSPVSSSTAMAPIAMASVLFFSSHCSSSLWEITSFAFPSSSSELSSSPWLEHRQNRTHNLKHVYNNNMVHQIELYITANETNKPSHA